MSKQISKKAARQELPAPVIEVREVSWTAGRVLRYQAFGMVTGSDGTSRVYAGDPMSSREEAIDALYREVLVRQDDLTRLLQGLRSMNQSVTAQS